MNAMPSSFAQNQWLFRRLESIYAAARENEQKIKRFQSFELQLMASASLPELLRTLLYTHSTYFKWDVVSLTLYDPNFELRQLCEHDDARPFAYRDLKFFSTDDELNQTLDLVSGLPRLAPFDVRKHAAFFPDTKVPLKSVALLPLLRDRCLLGSFNIGCARERRLSAEHATDFLQHLAGVIAVCLQTAAAKEKLRHLGITDALTGVRNRRYFDQRLPEEIARSCRGGSPVSCMFIDLDRFKSVNDEYGHLTGDKVLRATAKVIQNQLRATDVVARFGGEEFVVLLAHTDNPTACEIAERIRRNVQDQIIKLDNANTLQISVSIGVASLHGADRSTDIVAAGNKLVAAADAAVYAAKTAGRNRVINGNPEEVRQLSLSYA